MVYRICCSPNSCAGEGFSGTFLAGLRFFRSRGRWDELNPEMVWFCIQRIGNRNAKCVLVVKGTTAIKVVLEGFERPAFHTPPPPPPQICCFLFFVVKPLVFNNVYDVPPAVLPAVRPAVLPAVLPTVLPAVLPAVFTAVLPVVLQAVPPSCAPSSAPSQLCSQLFNGESIHTMHMYEIVFQVVGGRAATIFQSWALSFHFAVSAGANHERDR
jgi:hypothetical protein